MAKKELEKHLVKSSNIAWVAYDEESKTLYVNFHSGSTYSYDDVPIEIFNDLLNAGSKGRYFARKIKFSYKYKKLN